jgi:AraC family transcriptional activator of pobA
VREYARELNVSTSTLNRMCRERFGDSAKSVVAARVMSEAKRRLVYTRQPLDQIAYHLGYKDPAYFSRVFKKLENISPGEFRKQRQL